MNCSQIRIHLKDYIDDNVPPRLKAAIAGHISSCDECSKELAFLKTYLPQVKGITEITAPSGFEFRLQQKLPNPSHSKFSFQKRLFPIPIPVTTFTGFLIITAVIFFFNNPYKLMKGNQLNNAPAPVGYTLSGDQSEKKSRQKNQTPVSDSIAINEAKTEPEMSVSQIDEPKDIEMVMLALTLKLANRSLANESVVHTESQTAAPRPARTMNQYDAVDEDASGASDTKKTAEKTPNALDDITDGIKVIVNNLQGEMESIKEQSTAKSVQVFVIRIPAQNYQQFLTSIAKFGEINEPHPVVNTEEQKTVDIRLELINEN